MKGALYLRVSSEEQAARGHGIGYQREECRNKAWEMGCTQIVEYADEGESGSVLARPALDDLRRDLPSGDIDLVIAWDPDRLSRNLVQQLVITEEIERHSRLVFVRFERDNSPEGQLFYQLRGAIAQYEREKIRERTAAGRRQKARSGRLPFAFEPYGYRYNSENATLVIDQDEALVVQRVFEDYTTLRCSLSGLARDLTAEGIPTRRGAGEWHRQTIRQILSNPVYKGVYYANRRDMTGVGLNRYRAHGKVWGKDRPREEWIPVRVPAIIEGAIWDKAQGVMAVSGRLWRSRRSIYLLSGLLNCATCGLSMTGSLKNSWGRKVRYYTCHRSAGSPQARDCSRYVKADILEGLVWSVVAKWCDGEMPSSVLEDEGISPFCRGLVGSRCFADLVKGVPVDVKRQVLRQFVIGVEVGVSCITIRAMQPADCDCCHREGDLDAPEIHEEVAAGDKPARSDRH